jgi:hypothetical protein
MKDKRKFLGLLLTVIAGVILTVSVTSCDPGTGTSTDTETDTGPDTETDTGSLTKFEGTWFFDERPERNRTVTYVFAGNSFTSTNVFDDDTLVISGTFTFDDANLVFTYSDTYTMNGVETAFNPENLGMTNPDSRVYSLSEDGLTLTIDPLVYTKQK